MISPEEAWERIAARLETLEVVERPRREAAGRVLGRALEATIDVPGGDVSAMDGYALAPAAPDQREYPIDGIVAAGDPPGFELAAGSAVRIMTGGPVPAAADRVVPIELTDAGRERVAVAELPVAGAHIRRRGEVLGEGDPLLAAGSLLTPGAMGLLATHGFTTVPIYRPPRVAIITTGDEIVPPEVEPEPGQLRDSHNDFLAAAITASGSVADSLGIVADDPDELRARVEEGLERDVLLLSGGVSKGEFDLVEGVLGEAGCELLFDAVAIQPGKPVVAGVHRGGWVFGLPGNPASAMVCYWLFVRPALRRLMGIDDHFWGGALEATLSAESPAAKGRDLFVPAEVRFDDGEIKVHAHTPRGSHDLAAYARGTALLRVPAGTGPGTAGERCGILPIGEWLQSP